LQPIMRNIWGKQHDMKKQHFIECPLEDAPTAKLT